MQRGAGSRLNPTLRKLFSLAALFAAASLLAQQRIGPDEVRISSHRYAPQEFAVHVATNEVQVSVIVRDSKGHAISNLKASDFELYDEGKGTEKKSWELQRNDEAATQSAAECRQRESREFSGGG